MQHQTRRCVRHRRWQQAGLHHHTAAAGIKLSKVPTWGLSQAQSDAQVGDEAVQGGANMNASLQQHEGEKGSIESPR